MCDERQVCGGNVRYYTTIIKYAHKSAQCCDRLIDFHSAALTPTALTAPVRSQVRHTVTKPALKKASA
jgi:hypothetical protein